MKGGLLTAWLAAVAIITYRGVKRTPRPTPLPMPLPSEYVSSFIVFGGLSLIPAEGAGFAGAAGWALVLAMFLNLWNPAGGIIGSVGPAAGAKAPAAPPAKAPAAPPTANTFRKAAA